MISSKKRLVAVLLPAMFLPFVASLYYFVYTEDAFARVLYVLAKSFTVLWPILAFRFVLRGELSRFSLGDFDRKTMSEGVAFGALVVLGMVLLWQVFFFDLVSQATPRIAVKVRELGVSDYYLEFSLFLSLVHSLIEEYYWRWFVFGGLLRVTSSPVMAHVFAGAAFAAHHVVVLSRYFPTSWALVFGFIVGAGGICWSMMYLRHKSLVGAWISHAMVDLGILSIGAYILEV
ncbi:MAG: CPBP family intramembrane metalloprotease [Deltaproteobacteria bacterium]|nr:CPBP family intramembrane metalloprotease [Deltaproteobacteria bacterium]